MQVAMALSLSMGADGSGPTDYDPHGDGASGARRMNGYGSPPSAPNALGGRRHDPRDHRSPGAKPTAQRALTIS
eukprot:2539128-Prymnesium_polylepis.1